MAIPNHAYTVLNHQLLRARLCTALLQMRDIDRPLTTLNQAAANAYKALETLHAELRAAPAHDSQTVVRCFRFAAGETGKRSHLRLIQGGKA